jgi:aryl-alcohol dehydrogenase-like predicted oxidoreductase
MRYRTYPRTGWKIAEIGYGMWGMGGWSGSDDEESLKALDAAVALGCNFFDTAWAYGRGHSEQLLGRVLRNHRGTPLYVGTKIPPRTFRWPALPSDSLEDVFPADHIREYTEKSLRNLDVSRLDLQQFHVWTDAWADDDRWKRAVDELKGEGLIRSFGISVNRWEPSNVLRALESGVVDTVQVVYNIFDQNPEDELFPRCQERGVAIIARVPFDEGSLTGTLTTVARADAVKGLLPPGMTLAELALRFILHHPAVTTTIPGMRKTAHVRANLAASDGHGLGAEVVDELRAHKWVRDWVVA